MVYNGYYKVMSNIPKMGHLPTPDPSIRNERKGITVATRAKLWLPNTGTHLAEVIVASMKGKTDQETNLALLCGFV